MLTSHEITELLQAWSRGDTQALEKLIPLVDRELKKIAHGLMRNERPGHILQTTALVHEALIRLMQGEKIDWQSRKHFFGIVAWRMRQILVERARQENAGKRGKRAEHVELTDTLVLTPEESEELILLDEALSKLARIDERKAKIVEYRHFGGLTLEEVAEMMNLSKSTIEREWRLARAWLKREITESSEDE